MEHSVIQNVNKKLVAYYKSCNRHNFTLFPCRGDKNLFRIQTELNFCCFSNPSDPFSNPKHLCSFNTFLLDNFLKPSLVVSKPLITKLVDIWNSPIRQAFPNYPTRSKCRDSRVQHCLAFTVKKMTKWGYKRKHYIEAQRKIIKKS